MSIPPSLFPERLIGDPLLRLIPIPIRVLIGTGYLLVHREDSPLAYALSEAAQSIARPQRACHVAPTPSAFVILHRIHRGSSTSSIARTSLSSFRYSLLDLYVTVKVSDRTRKPLSVHCNTRAEQPHNSLRHVRSYKDNSPLDRQHPLLPPPISRETSSQWHHSRRRSPLPLPSLRANPARLPGLESPRRRRSPLQRLGLANQLRSPPSRPRGQRHRMLRQRKAALNGWGPGE